MTGSAWFWFVVVFFFFWVVPIALFFYQPKAKSVVHDSWQVMSYDELKWNRTFEIMLTVTICSCTSWAMWLLIKVGVLAWK